MDLDIGGEVAREIEAVAGAARAFTQDEKIDVRVAVQETEPRGRIDVVAAAETAIDVARGRDEQRREADGLERAVETAGEAPAKHHEALARQLRVVRVLAALDETHRVPGVTLAPAQRTLAGLQARAGGWLQREVTLVELRLALGAQIVVRRLAVGGGLEGGDARRGRGRSARPRRPCRRGRCAIPCRSS